MATRYWQGGTVAVAQVSTGSIDSVDATPANNTFTVTIGGISVSVAGDTDVATTATNLRSALNASTHPYFSAITWSGSSGDITGTADTPGVPFVAALTETGAGTGTVTDFSTTTANAGPNDFGTATNWSAQTAPTSSDTIIFADNAVNCCWGLSQTGLTGMVIYVDQTYTGKLGLDRRSFATSADGETLATAAPEYRTHALTLDYSTLEIGRELTATPANGSSRIKVENTRASASETIVHQTGSSAGPPCVMLKTAHASATIEVREATGGVGLCTDVPGDTGTVGTFEVSGDTAGTQVAIGNGVTITTYKQAEGTGVLRSAGTITTVTVTGGQLTVEGDGYTVTTLNADGGTVFYDGDVDITTANVDGGTLDASRSNQARTITTLNLTAGAYVCDADVTVTTFNEPTSGQLTVS